MQNFWKWIMQANSKRVFAVSLLIFLIVTGGSAWHYLGTSAQTDEAPKPEPKLPPLKTPVSTGMLKYILAQCANESMSPVKPFAPSLADAKNPILRTPRKDGVEGGGKGWEPWKPPTKSQTEGVGKVTEVKPLQTTTPAPPPPPVLTYGGFMTRADGTPVALVKNSATKKSAFLAVGDKVADTTLLALTHDSLTLRLPNGDEHTLPLRESVTLQ